MCDIIIVSMATTDSLSKHGSLSIPRTWRIKYNSTVTGQSFANNYNEKKKLHLFFPVHGDLDFGWPKTRLLGEERGRITERKISGRLRRGTLRCLFPGTTTVKGLKGLFTWRWGTPDS